MNKDNRIKWSKYSVVLDRTIEFKCFKHISVAKLRSTEIQAQQITDRAITKMIKEG